MSTLSLGSAGGEHEPASEQAAASACSSPSTDIFASVLPQSQPACKHGAASTDRDAGQHNRHFEPGRGQPSEHSAASDVLNHGPTPLRSAALQRFILECLSGRGSFSPSSLKRLVLQDLQARQQGAEMVKPDGTSFMDMFYSAPADFFRAGHREVHDGQLLPDAAKTLHDELCPRCARDGIPDAQGRPCPFPTIHRILVCGWAPPIRQDEGELRRFRGNYPSCDIFVRQLGAVIDGWLEQGIFSVCRNPDNVGGRTLCCSPLAAIVKKSDISLAKLMVDIDIHDGATLAKANEVLARGRRSRCDQCATCVPRGPTRWCRPCLSAPQNCATCWNTCGGEIISACWTLCNTFRPSRSRRKPVTSLASPGKGKS